MKIWGTIKTFFGKKEKEEYISLEEIIKKLPRLNKAIKKGEISLYNKKVEDRENNEIRQ